jgi:hypothetical protein
MRLLARYRFVTGKSKELLLELYSLEELFPTLQAWMNQPTS